MVQSDSKLIIPVHYKSKNSKKLELIAKGDWIDIPVQDDVIVREHEYMGEKQLFQYDREKYRIGDQPNLVSLNLGFSMVLPEGYEAHILPRSSTFRKYGLILGNSMGIIDNSYNGIDDIWQADFYATRPISKDVIIPGTRLLQFRIVKTMRNEWQDRMIVFHENDQAFNQTENRGGFGSTGR